LLVLIGIAIVVVGFALKRNPLVVIAVAAIATGLAAGRGLYDVIAAFGKAFASSRYVAIVWLVLPVIGMLERAGLRERARDVIAKVSAATTGRVLMAYVALRQLSAAFGLASLAGQAQTVRPLVAPMAEGAAEARYGDVPLATRRRIRAHAAAADNVGVFFGEDVFVSIGSILLIKSFLEQNKIIVEPWSLAVWAIPTAVFAFVIHAVRLVLLDRRLARELAAPPRTDA